MRYTALVGTVAAIFLSTNVHAEVEKNDGLALKRQIVGGGLAIGYGLKHCDMQVKADQRAEFDAKMTDLRKQIGLSGDLSDADVKNLIGLKSGEDEKMFCTGLKLTFPAMLAGFLAEKPVKEWSKVEAKADMPANSAKTTVAGWDVEPIAGSPGVCQIAHSYKDKDDDNADNAIVIRSLPDGFVLALSYAKWDWTAGEKMSVSLTTPDDVVKSDAAWTADTTGKVLVTKLPADTADALSKAEELTVKFTEGDAVFEAPKLGEALNAMKSCAARK